MTDQALVEAAAARLTTASAMHSACAPISDLIGPDNVETAYRVQELANSTRLTNGVTVVGRKIGLTSEAVQRQLGVDQPDFGFLFSDMAYADGDVIDTSRLLQPKAEAELAFILGEDLREGPLDVTQCRAAISYACAALEIVDSRIQEWKITFTDTVADNASSGVYVLGAVHRSLDDLEPADVTMTMWTDDVEVSTGDGRACLGDPLNAVSWLARRAREFGNPLTAGQLILSGALGPMVPIRPGMTVCVDISDFGSVTAHFTPVSNDGETTS